MRICWQLRYISGTLHVFLLNFIARKMFFLFLSNFLLSRWLGMSFSCVVKSMVFHSFSYTTIPTRTKLLTQSIPCVTGSLTRKKPTLITGRSEREQQHQPQTWASEYQSLETWEMLLLLLVFLFHQASSNILIFAWPSRLKTKEVHRRLHRLPQASAQSPSPCLLCEWMKWCKG